MDCGRPAFEDLGVLNDPDDCRRLLLFRHPELDAAQRSRAVGAGAAGLSRRGRAQVLDWLRWLEGASVDAVYCSPQPQCHEPARALAAAHDLQPNADPRLRDQEMGQWQGKVWQDLLAQDGDAVRTFFREFGETAAPGGESLGQAIERALQWWLELPPTAGRSVAVVLPGSVLSGFSAALLGLRLSRCVSLNLPHGALGILDAYESGVRIHSWNPAAVLDLS